MEISCFNIHLCLFGFLRENYQEAAWKIEFLRTNIDSLAEMFQDINLITQCLDKTGA